MRGIILAFALALSLNATPQEQVRVGSLKFTPPKGWKATGDSGPTTAIFAPPDVPAGKSCVIKVFPEEFDKDGFQAWYNRRWNRTVTGGHFVLRMSELEKKKVAGVDLVLRSAAYKKGAGEGFVLVIGFALKDKFFCIWYESDDFDYMEKHQDEVYGIFGSLELFEGGTNPVQKPGETKSPTVKPGEAKPPVVKPAETNPSTSKPSGGDPIVSAPNTYRTGKWIDDPLGPKRLDRLAEIAKQIQNPKADTEALLREAVRLCGFAIWTEERAKVAEPLGTPRLYLAITETEIKDFSEMFRVGHNCELSNLIAAIDVITKGIGSSKSTGPQILAWLQNGVLSGNPSIRGLTFFLRELHYANRNSMAVPFGESSMVLDPIQSLLILRVVTEEIGGPMRKLIRKEREMDQFASITPGNQDPEVEGVYEDAFVGGITGLWEAIIEVLNASDSAIGRTNQFIGRANTILSIIKFISTYSCLKSEMSVVQGQPLTRTKDTEPGNRRTVVATFNIDAGRVRDWLKNHRTLVALAGLDLDMPKTGPLKNVETFWTVSQSEIPSKQLIWAASRNRGLDKVLTNVKGEARVDFDGAPQPTALDPRNVVAVDKSVFINVTPQVKEVEIKQDLVDALTGAIGIRGGPVGFINPVLEVLYRLKWEGGTFLLLEVKDWRPAENVGQLTMTLNGTGRDVTMSSALIWTIDRKIDFKDVGMEVHGGQDTPQVDPSILKNLPATQRAQMEEAMRKASEMAKKAVYTGKLPGSAKIEIRDNRFSSNPQGCEEERETNNTAWTGKYDDIFVRKAPDSTEMMFRVEVDTEKKTASVVGIAKIKVKYVNRSQNGLVARSDMEMALFNDLNFVAPFNEDQPLVIPLKVTPDATTPGLMHYYGTETIRFTYGPEKKFRGEAILSFSVTRKIAKPK